MFWVMAGAVGCYLIQTAVQRTVGRKPKVQPLLPEEQALLQASLALMSEVQSSKAEFAEFQSRLDSLVRLITDRRQQAESCPHAQSQPPHRCPLLLPATTPKRST